MPLTVLAACSGSSQESNSSTGAGGIPASGSGSTEPATSAPRSGAAGGTLVVYFSRAGENYWYGGRRTLQVGNTRRLVDMITDRIDAETYEIVAADPYPTAYTPTVERNVEEMRADARPAIANPLPDLSRYGTVLIGSPIWASQRPMIMSTFVEGVDLAAKTVLPFVTYAVSGLAGVDAAYRSALPRSTAARGLAVQGERVDEGSADLDAWLRENRLTG